MCDLVAEGEISKGKYVLLLLGIQNIRRAGTGYHDQDT